MKTRKGEKKQRKKNSKRKKKKRENEKDRKERIVSGLHFSELLEFYEYPKFNQLLQRFALIVENQSNSSKPTKT